MAKIDMTTALSALSALIDKVRGIAQDDPQLTIETAALALQIQQALVGFQQKTLALETANTEMSSEIAAHKDRSELRKKYETKQVGGAWVMILRGQDEPYYCPACFDEDRFIPLQRRRQPYEDPSDPPSRHSCPSCEANYDH